MVQHIFISLVFTGLVLLGVFLSCNLIVLSRRGDGNEFRDGADSSML
jgi:hypothetical protein